MEKTGGTNTAKNSKMTTEELEKVLDLLVLKRVVRFKHRDLEVELSPLAYVTPSDEEIRTGNLSDVDTKLTEEEKLALLSEDDPERLLYIERQKAKEAEENDELYHSAED